MTQRKISDGNYQQRAAEFAVGDVVMTDGGTTGRIVALWPAIGMADVQFAGSNRRLPVEDLLITNDHWTNPPAVGNVPGGTPTVSVPGGPVPPVPRPKEASPQSQERVARAFVRKALYWAGKDRQYRATTEELDSGAYSCPKCRARGEVVPMKRAIYKRRDGCSDRLMGCPVCMFLIKRSDVLNDPRCQEEVV